MASKKMTHQATLMLLLITWRESMHCNGLTGWPRFVYLNYEIINRMTLFTCIPFHRLNSLVETKPRLNKGFNGTHNELNVVQRWELLPEWVRLCAHISKKWVANYQSVMSEQAEHTEIMFLVFFKVKIKGYFLYIFSPLQWILLKTLWYQTLDILDISTLHGAPRPVWSMWQSVKNSISWSTSTHTRTAGL